MGLSMAIHTADSWHTYLGGIEDSSAIYVNFHASTMRDCRHFVSVLVGQDTPAVSDTVKDLVKGSIRAQSRTEHDLMIL